MEDEKSESEDEDGAGKGLLTSASEIPFLDRLFLSGFMTIYD